MTYNANVSELIDALVVINNGRETVLKPYESIVDELMKASEWLEDEYEEFYGDDTLEDITAYCRLVMDAYYNAKEIVREIGIYFRKDCKAYKKWDAIYSALDKLWETIEEDV